MVSVKCPLSYSEQIERLKNFHKMKIEDDNQAKEILQKINYYRLSGYGIGLLSSSNKDEYREGISLQHLFRLYKFDSVLKNALMHVIEQIEIQLRTQISYALAMKYGALGYLNVTIFKDNVSKAHSKLINTFYGEVDRNKSKPFVKHHIVKYAEQFPIWVAVELFTFGNISVLFNIMNDDDQKTVAHFFKCTPRYLSNWIKVLVEIRNICAHYGRLYNLPLKHAPMLYKENNQYISKKGQQNKLFPAFLVIKRILNANVDWKLFYEFFKSVMKEYKDVVNLSFNGFPRNWEQVLDKELNHCASPLKKI